LTRSEAGFRFERFSFESGGHRLLFHGALGAPPRFDGTDFTVNAAGPDAAPLAALAKIPLPPRPYTIRGRIEKSRIGFRFQHLVLDIAGYRLSLGGDLGNFPRFNGTDLRPKAQGPDLARLAAIFNVQGLPVEPFEVSGSLFGNPTRFKSDGFSARPGESDLGGSFAVDFTKDPPEVSCDLRSDQIDLTVFRPVPAPTLKGPPFDPKPTLVIPDQRLDFDFLRKANGHLRWRAGTLLGRVFRTRHVYLDLNLKGGAIQVTRAEASRGNDERARLQFTLEPAASSYHILAKYRGDRLRPRQIADSAEKIPRVDMTIEFDGTGRSIRELALNGKAKIELNVFSGVLKTKLADLFRGDLLKTIASSLNPFSKKQPDTKLECGVFVAHLEKSQAKLDALAVRTDTTAIAGDGKLAIENEKLEFEWVAKPREGIGLSASSLSEPYLKLGGTLADPELEIKPLSATVSTGLAVVTFGLSVVAKDVWNRISAENDICGDVRKR
jgi:hypothetical protein